MQGAAHRPHDNSLRIVFASDHKEMSHAYAIRAICFMEEAGLSVGHAFDGNDFHATHAVFYLGDEPIGASRIRFFANFAKIERTGFRRAHRNVRVIKKCAEALFDHVAQKGYSRVLTFAEKKYSDIWTRFLGFKVLDGPIRRPNQDVDFYQLVREVEIPAAAIRENTPPKIMIRTEGNWDVPASFG